MEHISPVHSKTYTTFFSKSLIIGLEHLQICLFFNQLGFYCTAPQIRPNPHDSSRVGGGATPSRPKANTPEAHRTPHRAPSHLTLHSKYLYYKRFSGIIVVRWVVKKWSGSTPSPLFKNKRRAEPAHGNKVHRQELRPVVGRALT